MFYLFPDSINPFISLLGGKSQLCKCKHSLPLMTTYCISKGPDWGIDVGEQKISRASTPSENQLWASY